MAIASWLTSLIVLVPFWNVKHSHSCFVSRVLSSSTSLAILIIIFFFNIFKVGVVVTRIVILRWKVWPTELTRSPAVGVFRLDMNQLFLFFLRFFFRFLFRLFLELWRNSCFRLVDVWRI